MVWGLKIFTEDSELKTSLKTLRQARPLFGWKSRKQSRKFTVVTRHTGLPIELVRSLGLIASEILDKTKDLNLTVKEAEKIKEQNWVDSIVQRNQKIKTPNSSFFPIKFHLTETKTISAPLYSKSRSKSRY